MWVPVVLSYILCLLISIWGIQFYLNLFKKPLYFLIPIVLAVFVPISIILLLPLDYVQHHTDKKLVLFDLPDNVILYMWKSTYWTTFLLTWLILPTLQEYYRSGLFKSYNKLTDALRKNLRFQLVILGVSILAIIYLGLEVGLSFGHMKSMIIALSHIYSLILALWLMAHGLVNIPRNKWTFGSVMGNLNYYYLQVPKLIDDLEDCKISFKEQILEVLVLQKNFTTDVNDTFIYRDWILELYNKIPEDLKELMELQYLSEAPTISRNQLNNDFMTKLTSKFNSNHYKLNAYESEFNDLFNQIILLEDVTNSSTSNPQFRIENVNNLLPPKSRFVFYNYVNPILNRVYAVILFSFSFIIIESEFFHSTKLSLINLIFNKINPNLVQFLICGVVFSVMVICALNSLTKLKVFNIYHLVPHKSDPVSTCFYATYIVRLTIPLSYNFITLFVSRDSIYEDWYGKSIHLTGLFNLMNNWIPRLILLPIIFTLFNVYDKLKRRLGFSTDLYATFGFDDYESAGEADNLNHKRKDMIIIEAKRIINREYTKRQATLNLRPFNLQQAADMNYQANRRNFEDNLVNSNNMSNRIDTEYHDTPYPNQPSESIWSSLGNQFTNLRDQISTRFTRSRENSMNYQDEPLDNFDYDDDAERLLVL